MSAQLLKSISSSFVNGSFKPSQGSLHAIISPVTESVVANIREASVSDVHAAVSAARSALNGPWENGRIAKKLADAMESRAEDFAIAEAVTGKPITDARRIYGPNLRTYTLREPLGVCGLITSFNYPLLLATWKLAPALAAGNTVILKPARQTPFSSLLLASVSSSANPILPPGVLNVLLGGPSIGQALVTHRDTAKISFTGSTAVGRRVGAEAVANGPGMRRTALELGGKNAIIVCGDADLEAAVGHTIEASFSNAGQNCCAGSRIFVHSSVYDDFLGLLKDRASKLRIGDPMDEATQIGPLVDGNALRKVQTFVDNGVRDGLDLVLGGSPVDGKGFFVRPTIFKNVPDNHAIATEEIFGPVVAVLKPFETMDEVIERANDTPYGLAAGVMTTSIVNAERCVSGLKSGFVWVNTYNFVPPFLPLGGSRESGYGKDCGLEAIDEFTFTKSVYSSF
ncbi:Aldehyde/histidinol dehydrogenase [Chytridium lagenaria]|nr:Aldehyde/histidinol dehydrogenase [Chytridium lagenaria]